MTNSAAEFAVNTYAYAFSGSAADTVARLADQGCGGVELMFFPGHLWPAELDPSALRSLCEQRLRLVTVIRVIYDVANAHFIGEPPRKDCAGCATGSRSFIFPIRPGGATSMIRWAAEMFRSRALPPS